VRQPSIHSGGGITNNDIEVAKGIET